MHEKQALKMNGFLGILFVIILGFGAFLLIGLESYFLAVLMIIAAVLMLSSLIVVQPNEGSIVTFFGRYIGTISESGFWMTLPLTAKSSISLKVNNFNSKVLKVNDIEGNPIEIAAVVVFKVTDTAKAAFDVQNYYGFVELQSETAIRHIATKYPYDNFEEKGYSLRSNVDEIAQELTNELQQRLEVAGVKVIEARLTHLAYATEIASAMLQRQQASAIVAARQKIVFGAVSMAQMAIEQLQNDGTVELDEERKVAMINNLLVAIVSERSAQPVINTGSLY